MGNIAVNIANLSLYNAIMQSHFLAPFSCSIQFGSGMPATYGGNCRFADSNLNKDKCNKLSSRCISIIIEVSPFSVTVGPLPFRPGSCLSSCEIWSAEAAAKVHHDEPSPVSVESCLPCMFASASKGGSESARRIVPSRKYAGLASREPSGVNK